jgi:hypothetical protein
MTARFVVDDADENDALRIGSDLSLGMRRLRRNYDKKKPSDANGMVGSSGGNGSSLNHSASQARRLHAIVIEELPPDRLSVNDKNDGATLVTSPYIRD